MKLALKLKMNLIKHKHQHKSNSNNINNIQSHFQKVLLLQQLNNHLSTLPRSSLLLLQLEILSKLSQLQITSHLLKRTQLKADMQAFYSLQPPKSKHCTPYMRILLTSKKCMRILIPSECSLKTQVLELKKLNFSTKHFSALVTSIH